MQEEPEEQFVEDKLRTPDVVAQRCLILYAVILAGHGESRHDLVEWLQHENLWEAVSPKEEAFLISDQPTAQEIVSATWRAEAIYPLVWALGKVSTLPLPAEISDSHTVQEALPKLYSSTSDFVLLAQLRSDEVIQAANNSIYNIHWKVRDAILNGRPVPDGFDPEIVQERHYALNWLIGYCGQEWDEVTTDT